MEITGHRLTEIPHIKDTIVWILVLQDLGIDGASGERLVMKSSTGPPAASNIAVMIAPG